VEAWLGAQKEERMGSLGLWGYRQEGGLREAVMGSVETQG
jgi:hypothetical protein